MSATRILCNWQPTALDHTLAQQFERHLATLGITIFYTEVRNPARNAVLSDIAFTWHQDPGGALLLVLWANIRPVEVRLADSSLPTTFPGDIVLVDNRVDKHRAPADQTGRWTVSGVTGEHWMATPG